jgi:acyl-coenzyme A synthetase/AMP-(fatty) acid ligase
LPYWERDGDQLRREAGGAALVAEMPDHVEWLGPDLLRPLGRRDGAVQIAGVNVHPERVRAVLLAHPGVAEARVRLMRPDEGDWLKAFVVAREGVEATGLRAALEDWTRRRLTAPERPRAITLGTVLPVTPSGKPADWFIEEA